MVSRQIEIALDFKDRLQSISFVNLEILGGAPRDWAIGNPAHDIDFYVLDSDEGFTELDEVEIIGVSGLHNLGEQYVGASIRSVQEFFYRGMRINLIFHSATTREEVLKEFPTSVSKAYFDFTTNTPILTKEAILSFATGILILDENEQNVRYVDKIKGYFPHMKVGTLVDMSYKCMDIVLNSYKGATK